MPTVAVIQHVVVEGPGAIAGALAAAGLREQRVRVFAGDPVPTSVAGLAGLVVMGGPMGVADAPRLPYLRDELRLLTAALQAELPVLGICLGAQLLAAARGAEVRPGAAPEIGWHPVTRTAAGADDPLFGAAPAQLTAFHWHGDVFDLPRGAVWLAASAQTPCQAFRCGVNAWGLLFHLEVDAAGVAAMVVAFPEDLAAAGLEPAAIVQDGARHLPTVETVGGALFARWTARVSAWSASQGRRPGRR
jgi:GMP synthase-like glutamine amidotransferase